MAVIFISFFTLESYTENQLDTSSGKLKHLLHPPSNAQRLVLLCWDFDYKLIMH